jgi:hypothetical protein
VRCTALGFCVAATIAARLYNARARTHTHTHTHTHTQSLSVNPAPDALHRQSLEQPQPQRPRLAAQRGEEGRSEGGTVGMQGAATIQTPSPLDAPPNQNPASAHLSAPAGGGGLHGGRCSRSRLHSGT